MIRVLVLGCDGYSSLSTLHMHSLVPHLACHRYEAYCQCGDFIREHIFPGGHLPSIGAMVEASRGTGLSLKV